MSQFVEVKTSELTGRALDWEAAQVVGGQGRLRPHQKLAIIAAMSRL